MELKAMKKDILGLFLLVTVVVMEVNISLQQHCPTAINSQYGYALIGSEYKSFTSIDYAKCMMECEVDDRCMSLNFLLTTKTCDLNTQIKESTPRCLQPKENSVYTRSMAFRTPKLLKSCLALLLTCKSQESGEYWIEPEQGKQVKVLCDMTTDGGGWTVMKRMVLQSPLVPPNTKYNMYKLLASYNTNDLNTIPSGGALLDIKNKMGFHQIHFYCHKVNVGRVVSIMTKNNTAGQDVVRYFSDNTAFPDNTFPDACDSFDRLPEDTSVLSQNCKKWGKDKDGGTELNKWGNPTGGFAENIVKRPFNIVSEPQHYYGIIGNTPKCYCDDSSMSPEPCSVNDTWLISLR